MRTPPGPYIGGRSGPSWLEGWAHIIARESSAAPKMRHAHVSLRFPPLRGYFAAVVPVGSIPLWAKYHRFSYVVSCSCELLLSSLLCLAPPRRLLAARRCRAARLRRFLPLLRLAHRFPPRLPRLLSGLCALPASLNSRTLLACPPIANFDPRLLSVPLSPPSLPRSRPLLYLPPLLKRPPALPAARTRGRNP